jgi:hypothetical protein
MYFILIQLELQFLKLFLQGVPEYLKSNDYGMDFFMITALKCNCLLKSVSKYCWCFKTIIHYLQDQPISRCEVVVATKLRTKTFLTVLIFAEPHTLLSLVFFGCQT